MSELPQTIGRYRIVRLLGSGAMGDVYLAEDPNIDRELAIKTVRVVGGTPEDVEDRKQRLLREARAAGKFVHPNVVTLFDADEADGTLYLAFEYVPPGIDLAKRMTSQPQVTLRQALRWVREIAQALQFAHERDIVHRDIKPSNVLIAADGTAKVADFGIAKLLGPGTELTRTGSVVGSPQYMSPEQVRGETLDGRSDVFSLGVVFYELLCGIRPFGGETLSTLVFEILSKEPPPVGSLRPSLPGELVALAHRMLAKDRNHRSASADAVVADIRELEASIPAHQLDDTAAPSDVEETRRIATAISQQIDRTAENRGTGSEVPTVASDAISTPGFVPPPPPAGTGAPSDPTLAASQHPPAASAQVPPAPAPTPMSTQLPARGSAAAASSDSKTLRNVVLGLGVLGFIAVVGLVGLWFLLHSFAPQFLPAALGGSQPADFMEMETAEAALPDDETAESATPSSVPDAPASAAPVAEPAGPDDEPPDETESQTAVEAIREEVAQARTEPESAPPPPRPSSAREPASPPPPPPPVRRVEPESEPEPEPVRSAPPPSSVTRPPPEPEREAERPSEPPPDPEPRVDRDLQRWRAAASRANRELSTGLRFRFDVKPKDVLAIVRVWPEGGDIIVKGQAEDFKDGRRGRDMTLPGAGDHLVQLVVGGEVQHSILVHASAGNPQTTTVSLDLR